MGTQYLSIISFMDCSMCPKPIPEPRLLVVPHTLTCSPECSRERAKLQRQRRKAANAAKREAAAHFETRVWERGATRHLELRHTLPQTLRCTRSQLC